MARATTEKVRSAGGTTLAFERAGQGPALILVDGAWCTRTWGRARTWRRSSRRASP